MSAQPQKQNRYQTEATQQKTSLERVTKRKCRQGEAPQTKPMDTGPREPRTRKRIMTKNVSGNPETERNSNLTYRTLMERQSAEKGREGGEGARKAENQPNINP